MVENTKKFAEGRQETASGILKEVIQQEKKENAGQQRKETSPSAHDLKAQKEKKSQKEVEELAKELLRKGTLRK